MTSEKPHPTPLPPSHRWIWMIGFWGMAMVLSCQSPDQIQLPPQETKSVLVTSSVEGMKAIYQGIECEDGSLPYEVEYHKLDVSTSLDHWVIRCRSGQKRKLFFWVQKAGDLSAYQYSWARYQNAKVRAERSILEKKWKEADGFIEDMRAEEPNNPYALLAKITILVQTKNCSQPKIIEQAKHIGIRKELSQIVYDNYNKVCGLD